MSIVSASLCQLGACRCVGEDGRSIAACFLLEARKVYGEVKGEMQSDQTGVTISPRSSRLLIGDSNAGTGAPCTFLGSMVAEVASRNSVFEMVVAASSAVGERNIAAPAVDSLDLVI
jgi:hypothetical protein